MEKIFYETSIEEQETIIHIDYSMKHVKIYTSNKSIYKRLYKKLGNPTKEFITKNKISGAEWLIPFSEKSKITSVFSRPLLIGNRK